MPTDPTILALALSVPVAFLVGVLAARGVYRRRLVVETVRLEAQMTAEVEERYEAYVALEQQVHRIFRRLDELESETAASLETTGVHLHQLGEVMAACEGTTTAGAVDPAGRHEQEVGSTAASDRSADDLEWMDELDDVLEVYCGDEEQPAQAEEQPTQPEVVAPQVHAQAADAGPAEQSTRDIAQWEHKLETLREEKRTEIERQGRLIAELTERLQRLQTQETRTDQPTAQEYAANRPQREASESVVAKERDLWRDKYQSLEGERTFEEAEVLALREEAASLAAQVAVLEPLQAIQAELTERVGALEAELTEQAEELERARTEVDERGQALEHARAEVVEHTQALEHTRAELTRCENQLEDLGVETEQRKVALERLHAELDQRKAELESLHAEVATESDRAAQVERRYAELESQRRTEIEALELRVHELEPLLGRVSELRAQVEACEKREDAQRSRADELEADGLRQRSKIDTLRDEREAATEMLVASKRALEEADARQEELEERVASLSEHNESLSCELSDLRRNADGQTTRISTLMAELDEVRNEGENLRRDAQSKGSMVEAAEGLLAELKPKLEALEQRLNRRETD